MNWTTLKKLSMSQNSSWWSFQVSTVKPKPGDQIEAHMAFRVQQQVLEWMFFKTRPEIEQVRLSGHVQLFQSSELHLNQMTMNK